MKKMMVLILLLNGILLAQNPYHASIEYTDLAWQNHNEWGAHLNGDLYYNGDLLEPSETYYYRWQWWANGEWVDRSIGYGQSTHFIDGDSETYFLLRVKISGPGFSATSPEKSIGKSGTIQEVDFNAFKENGNAANADTKGQIWATVTWLDRDFGLHFYLTQNESNLLKDVILSPETFAEKFFNWQTNTGDEYYRNFGNIIPTATTSDVAVHHKTYHNATLKATASGDIPLPEIPLQIKDPWLVDQDVPPYGLRNQGMSAPFKPVLSGANNLGVNTAHQGVFMNQNSDFQPDIPIYRLRAPATTQADETEWYFQQWDGTDVTFQHPDQRTSSVVFRHADATAYSNGRKVTVNTGDSIPKRNPPERWK